jgi:hypothetical protein
MSINIERSPFSCVGRFFQSLEPPRLDCHCLPLSKGRGNLGFGWIEKKDLQSNKLTRTEYSQTYPYTGQTTATKEYIEAKNTIEANNTYQYWIDW